MQLYSGLSIPGAAASQALVTVMKVPLHPRSHQFQRGARLSLWAIHFASESPCYPAVVVYVDNFSAPGTQLLQRMVQCIINGAQGFTQSWGVAYERSISEVRRSQLFRVIQIIKATRTTRLDSNSSGKPWQNIPTLVFHSPPRNYIPT